MRFLDIPPSPYRIDFENQNVADLFRSRLQQGLGARAALANYLVCHMVWPNNADVRAREMNRLWLWLDGAIPEQRDFRKMFIEWGRVADTMNIHYGLSQGGHQNSRGGASVGKAISVASEFTKVKAVKGATLWSNWTKHKDVAHLIAATFAICRYLKVRQSQTPLGVHLQDLLPIQVAWLLPDLVLAIALTYQEYGLNSVPKGSDRPMLDPESVWRVPTDINIEPVRPPVRTIPTPEIVMLNARRAGNRGRANRREPALVG